MSFHWLYLNAQHEPAETLPTSATTEPFPTQADAEAFIGESWKELLDGGIACVELFNGDHKIYGPMDLAPVAE